MDSNNNSKIDDAADSTTKAEASNSPPHNTVRFVPITLAIPTKTYDGGYRRGSEPMPKRSRRPVHKKDDPFMYYSHQETRMNSLLLSMEGDNEDDNGAIVDSGNVARKTRISFELHPALMLEGLYQRLGD